MENPEKITTTSEQLCPPKGNKVYFNKPQRLTQLIGANISVIVAGRRTGKTDSIAAPFVLRNMQRMPGSTGGIVVPTFKHGLTNTLPGLLAAWKRWGYIRGVHYVIGRKPPKTFARPIIEPAEYEHVISFYNGSCAVIISQDRPGSSNSLTLSWLLIDEAKFSDYNKLKDETLPANGGIKSHFGKHSCNHSIMILSDMPQTQKGSWFLHYQQKMDTDVISAIEGLVYDIWRLKQRIKQCRDKDKVKQLTYVLRHKDKQLNQLRSVATYYKEYSSIENLQLLGENYIRQMKRDLTPLTFQTSILCQRIGIAKDGFYSSMREKHKYDASDMEYLDSVAQSFYADEDATFSNEGLDARADKDCNPLAPICIGMDYNANINWIVAGQPFLIEVLKQILSHSRYTYDISAIENSEWKYLIICNALPTAWELEGMQHILPHWTVTEFLEQCELFLNGEFNIDEKTRSLTFAFNADMMEDMDIVPIEKVTDSHQVEITSAEVVQNSYIEQRNLAYAECSHQMWKYYSCDWVKKQVDFYTWNNIQDMKNHLDQYLDCAGNIRHSYYRRLHFCRAEDTFFVLKCVRTATVSGVIHHYMRYQPVNQFGQRIIDEREDAEVTEIRIVPVCIDHTDNTHGDLIFIDCGEYGDDTDDAEDDDTSQTPIVNILTSGEKEKKEEYFDKLYVGFYDGYYNKHAPYHPRVDIDPVAISPDNTPETSHDSMRLSGVQAPEGRTSRYAVDHSRKFTFTFIADAVPDVRSIFLIHGKKYLAEKITATISENGLSKQMKLVAYRLI